MDSKVLETMIKCSLLDFGCSAEVLQACYERVYVSPDLTKSKEEIEQKIAQLDDEELAGLFKEYLRGSRLQFVQELVTYFRKVFSVECEVRVAEDDDVEVMMLVYDLRIGSGLVHNSDVRLLVNLEAIKGVNFKELVAIVGHEAWHLYQVYGGAKWALRMRGCDRTLIEPEKADLTLLRVLNIQYPVQPEQDADLYRSQIMEAEAFLAKDLIEARLENSLRCQFLFQLERKMLGRRKANL